MQDNRERNTFILLNLITKRLRSELIVPLQVLHQTGSPGSRSWPGVLMCCVMQSVPPGLWDTDGSAAVQTGRANFLVAWLILNCLCHRMIRLCLEEERDTSYCMTSISALNLSLSADSSLQWCHNWEVWTMIFDCIIADTENLEVMRSRKVKDRWPIPAIMIIPNNFLQ